MKILKLLTMCSFLLAGSAVYADGFGFNLGPVDLQFNTSEGPYTYEYKPVLDNPICVAISNQMQLEMTVEGVEKVSDKEIIVVTKRVVVEPYAYGITNEGKPILRGKVIDEKLIKKVTVKYGEPQFSDERISDDQKKQGYFSGWFKSDKNKNINIRKMSNIRIVEGTHFDVPKNFKGITEENIQVICQLPVSE